MSELKNYAGYFAFAVALVATLASLFLSEVMDWTPCVLCWYQRVLMYPLVVIIGVGIIRRDTVNWSITALVTAGIGWVIALYHSLLQWGVISENIAPCVEGVSCVTKHFSWLGFITIPFLSLVAFTIIFVMSLIVWKGASSEQRV